MNTGLDYSAHGKLLLSAEYFVLDGATALALPTRHGQSLTIREQTNAKTTLSWHSLDEKGEPWFEAMFQLPALEILHTSDEETAAQLKAIFLAARRQNPEFLMNNHVVEAFTRLDFPRNWGLGTSSTLISNIAQWANADPFKLLFDTMGGSGYDIACAAAEGPILYRLEKGKPFFESCNFNPSFSNQLYFIYLGKKQNTREGIARYRQQADRKSYLHNISALSYEMLKAESLNEFQSLMRQHETLVSETIGLPPIRQEQFSDFPGTLKSLGAWGGDFMLAASDADEKVVRQYFEHKGLMTCLSYDSLILQQQ